MNNTAGEECDDTSESESSNYDCSLSVCGDYILNLTAGEECDDGNSDDTDYCLSNCTSAICGDGILWFGNKGCDDGGETAVCDSYCTSVACGDGLINNSPVRVVTMEMLTQMIFVLLVR